MLYSGIAPVTDGDVVVRPANDVSIVYDSLAEVNGRLFATRDSDLYELDPATGAETGRFGLPVNEFGSEVEVVWTPLVADGDHLWVTIADGGDWLLTRLDVAQGTFDLQAKIDSDSESAVLAGGRVWVADRRGSLSWIDISTGRRTEVDSGFPKGDTVLDSEPSLFVGSDGSLWALDQPAQVVSQLDLTDGTVIASYRLKFRPSNMVATATELVFANSYDDRITLLPRSALEPAG